MSSSYRREEEQQRFLLIWRESSWGLCALNRLAGGMLTGIEEVLLNTFSFEYPRELSNAPPSPLCWGNGHINLLFEIDTNLLKNIYWMSNQWLLNEIESNENISGPIVVRLVMRHLNLKLFADHIGNQIMPGNKSKTFLSSGFIVVFSRGGSWLTLEINQKPQFTKLTIGLEAQL